MTMFLTRAMCIFFLLCAVTSCGSNVNGPIAPETFDGTYTLISIRVDRKGYSGPGPENATGYLRLENGNYTLNIFLPPSVVWTTNGFQVTQTGTYTPSRSVAFKSHTGETYRGTRGFPPHTNTLYVKASFILPLLDIPTENIEDFTLLYRRESTLTQGLTSDETSQENLR